MRFAAPRVKAATAAGRNSEATTRASADASKAGTFSCPARTLISPQSRAACRAMGTRQSAIAAACVINLTAGELMRPRTVLMAGRPL